jgi:macrolide-specific efflux system membrane fusion protein
MSEQPVLPLLDEIMPTRGQPDSAGAAPVSRSRRRIWLGAAACLAALLTWWLSGRGESKQLPSVVEVKRGDVVELATASGSLQPQNWVDVGAQVSGQLRSLQVQVGDHVQQGDLLAELDAEVQNNHVKASRASLDAEQAQVIARRAAVDLARSNLQRQKELVARALVSRADLDIAANQLAAAESALAELQSRISFSLASLASDKAQLSYSRIFAPMNGTVVSVDAMVGQTLNALQQVPTILRIADLATMTAQAEVSEADIGRVRPGIKAYFTTLGGHDRRWEGAVRQILPTPKVRNGAVFYPVLFDVPNPDGTLLPQMTAQVFFVIAEAIDCLQVPSIALRYSQGRSDVAEVSVLTSAGYERRNVAVGVSDRITVQVNSGLSEHEQIVIPSQLQPVPPEPRRISES